MSDFSFEPYIRKMIITQPGDCCGGESIQDLTIESEDGGGGPFLVISTERWAVDADKIDEFADTLKKFIKNCPEIFE